MEKDKYTDIILDKDKGYIIDHQNEIMNFYENDEEYLKENFKDFIFLNKADSSFKAQALKYAHKVVDTAQYTSYFSYWPIYNNMNDRQSQWYFYWRNQFVNGHYLATDVSYIYLYIYEILSGVGWEKPDKGLFLLKSIWEQYYESHNELSNNLPDWIYDFMRLHSLYRLDSLFQFVKSKQVYNSYIGEVISNEFQCVTSHDIFRVTGYKIKPKDKDNTSDKALIRSFSAVNDCFVQDYGTNIFDYYVIDPAVCEKKYAYINAVKDDVVSYNIEYKNYCGNENLRKFLVCIIKNFNNIYNRLSGMRGYVKVDKLDSKYLLAIELSCSEFLHERNYRKISIDEDFLEKIKRESLELHDLLTINNDDDADGGVLKTDKRDDIITNLNDRFDEEKEREDGEHSLSDIQIRALKIIVQNDDPLTDLKRLAEDNNLMMESIINSINEYYLEDIGDIIIDIVNMKPYIIHDYEYLVNNLLEE